MLDQVFGRSILRIRPAAGRPGIPISVGEGFQSPPESEGVQAENRHVSPLILPARIESSIY